MLLARTGLDLKRVYLPYHIYIPLRELNVTMALINESDDCNKVFVILLSQYEAY